METHTHLTAAAVRKPGNKSKPSVANSQEAHLIHAITHVPPDQAQTSFVASRFWRKPGSPSTARIFEATSCDWRQLPFQTKMTQGLAKGRRQSQMEDVKPYTKCGVDRTYHNLQLPPAQMLIWQNVQRIEHHPAINHDFQQAHGTPNTISGKPTVPVSAHSVANQARPRHKRKATAQTTQNGNVHAPQTATTSLGLYRVRRSPL